MLSMNNDSDLEEYLVSLLGDDSSRMFLKELIPRWKPSRALAAGDDDLMTPLVRPKQDDLVLFAEKKHKSKGKDKKVLTLMISSRSLSTTAGQNWSCYSASTRSISLSWL